MNWGKGIVIAIVLFISYIMFMVITMIRTSSDLVEENYYEEGVKFEQKIQAIKNSKAIKDQIKISVDQQFLAIEFPNSVSMDSVTNGVIHLYRPENGKLDKHFSFSKEAGNIQLIPKEKITEGYYNLLLSWKTNESDFYVDKGRIKI
jgi:nitrogen fixation protein FixH